MSWAPPRGTPAEAGGRPPAGSRGALAGARPRRLGPRFGLRHERRLYLDAAADELRGEDRLTPLKAKGGEDRRRFVPFAVRFHLHPEVSAPWRGTRRACS